jgi:hypothetical protein
MTSEGLGFPLSPQVQRLFASPQTSSGAIRPSGGELAGAVTASSGDHYCGPNCPEHFFAITRNPSSKGIDILA